MKRPRLKLLFSCLRNQSRLNEIVRRHRRVQLLILVLVAGMITFGTRVSLAGVKPYLQNPAQDAMTVIWFTETNTAGTLTVNLADGGTQVISSKPELKSELVYHPDEPPTSRSNSPWMHRIRVTGLEPGTRYAYSVTQGEETFTGQIQTVPKEMSSVRFMVYADSETEPESTGSRVGWTLPGNPGSKRQYVVDQTTGYSENLRVIASRNPAFIGIAGDIVESGGEQRDWDEFWRHNAGDINNLASSTPIFAAPGNHEVYGGPGPFGGYNDEGSIRGQGKFKTYWEAPSNGTSAHDDRYYRIDYGPITYISLDVTNGQPDSTGGDTNWMVGDGPGYPDFNPGSIQYQWLEKQLAEAQKRSRFTFVQLHHVPYSTGPHGFPPGTGTGFDNQSGQPVRVLTPLFAQYGVDAVFAGHDETYQHSVVDGIHFWDIGMGGDGLRGPGSGLDSSNPSIQTNPYQKFTAHLNATEVWNGPQLISGGKHYGHMEVNVSFDEPTGTWKAQLDPVHVFPLMDTDGNIMGWERRVYDDTTILTAQPAPQNTAAVDSCSRNSTAVPKGIWTDGSPNANLASSHVLGAGTLLANGSVIVAGGLGMLRTSAITTAELYNPGTKTWSITGPLGMARWSLDAISLDNGKTLFAGGSNAFRPDAALATAELYDPEKGIFSPTGNDLSVARQSSGISRLNDGRILISGGNAAGYNLNGTGVPAVDIYDPDTNTFSSSAPLNSGRSLHAQVTLRDGRVLVVGGAQRDAELFDPATNTWSTSANLLPTTLKDMKAFELCNGRIFIAGGQNTLDGVTTDDTWFFDIGSMQFTPGPSMAGFNYTETGTQIGVSDYTAFDLFSPEHPLHGRYLLFAGGEHDPLVGPDVELHSASIYDAVLNKFFDVGPMPFIHDDHPESLLPINAAGNPEVLKFSGNRTMSTSRFEFLISLQ